MDSQSVRKNTIEPGISCQKYRNSQIVSCRCKKWRKTICDDLPLRGVISRLLFEPTRHPLDFCIRSSISELDASPSKATWSGHGNGVYTGANYRPGGPLSAGSLDAT
jgi:hypothetical protein